MPIRPQDQNPDRSSPGRQPARKAQDERQYGKNSSFDPEAEETEGEEYKSDGLAKIDKYTVDKH